MSASPNARCKSCQAPIVWAFTDRGQRMPVDRHPAPGGNVRLIHTERTWPLARVIGATIDLFDPDDDGTRYVAHFVTCPDAQEWLHD